MSLLTLFQLNLGGTAPLPVILPKHAFTATTRVRDFAARDRVRDFSAAPRQRDFTSGS